MRWVAVFFILLAIVVPVFAEDDSMLPPRPILDGFFGIPWGNTSDAAKKAMLEKGFTYAGTPKPDELVFTGSTFANLPVKLITLSFFKNQLCRAFVDVTDAGSDDKNYNTLVAVFVDKYGVQYQPNPNTNIWECKDDNSIFLIKSPENGIGITYYNKALFDQFDAAKQADEKSKIKSSDL